ncbi:MAG: ABC transporter permease [Alphaproteobacteria bacterium]|nr:ABC transporter permease [Alphaproteobacteria bacterium]
MATEPDIDVRAPSLLARARDSDLWFSFTRSPVVVVAASVTALYFLAALLAPLISPHNPFDPGSLVYSDAFTPPAWVEGGQATYLLGTDDQGRDILSTLIYGARISLLVGFAAVMLSAVIGITLGILAGYLGGIVETITMRAADVQLTVPGILVALMIDGVVRIKLKEWSAGGGFIGDMHETISLFVLIFAIGLSDWPQYARVVRGATMVEKGKEYVQAAKVIGVHPLFIMIRHILPNVLGPVLVLATIGLALAIIAEATLSFLGVGMPPTTPSLGTLIRIGNNFLFSGEWWITFFPCIALILLVLSVNLLGDWLRDALNPKLR